MASFLGSLSFPFLELADSNGTWWPKSPEGAWGQEWMTTTFYLDTKVHCSLNCNHTLQWSQSMQQNLHLAFFRPTNRTRVLLKMQSHTRDHAKDTCNKLHHLGFFVYDSLPMSAVPIGPLCAILNPSPFLICAQGTQSCPEGKTSTSLRRMHWSPVS